MKTKLIPFIALFLLLLVTGVFWGTWFTLTRSIEDFSAAEFIHIGKVIIGNVALPMSIIMPSCILVMILSSWFYQQKKINRILFKYCCSHSDNHCPADHNTNPGSHR